MLTAGPNGGNVTGQAVAGANLVATTIGDPTATSATDDDATATLDSSTVRGLFDVDILGGMVGTNTVNGVAVGDFDVTADSIKGAATGSSDADAYGIFNDAGDGNITLSGNIDAIAQLTNTVTARTIEGTASATATGDAIGLGGYSINIIGSGVITASADPIAAALLARCRVAPAPDSSQPTCWMGEAVKPPPPAFSSPAIRRGFLMLLRKLESVSDGESG